MEVNTTMTKERRKGLRDILEIFWSQSMEAESFAANSRDFDQSTDAEALESADAVLETWEQELEPDEDVDLQKAVQDLRDFLHEGKESK